MQFHQGFITLHSQCIQFNQVRDHDSSKRGFPEMKTAELLILIIAYNSNTNSPNANFHRGLEAQSRPVTFDQDINYCHFKILIAYAMTSPSRVSSPGHRDRPCLCLGGMVLSPNFMVCRSQTLKCMMQSLNCTP